MDVPFRCTDCRKNAYVGADIVFNIHVECDGRTSVRRRWGTYNGHGCVRFPNGIAVLEQFSSFDPVCGGLDTPVAFHPVCGKCAKGQPPEYEVTVKRHRANQAEVARLRADIERGARKRQRYAASASSESDSDDDARRRHY